MLTMAVGHSDDVDTQDAIAAAIEQCRTTLDGVRPQAGILFSAVDTFDPSMLAAVQQAFPGVGLMGSTSAAEISSSAGYAEDSVTLALFASDTADITVGWGAGLGEDVDAACAAAASQALAGTVREPKVCVMVTEAFVVDPQLTLEAMSAAFPAGVVVLGGTAARNDFTAVTPTYQFADGQVGQDGVAVLLFSGPVAFSATVGMGFRTLGPRATVTRSEYGAIQTVDDGPATDFLKRYLDSAGPSSYANPLAVFEDGTEEFYLRAMQSADPQSGAIAVSGSVPVGAQVQLTTADTEEILQGTRDALQRAVDTFPAGATPEAALIFSCAVRKFLLGSKTRLEADIARAVLGTSVPVCGTYCYGEVGPVKGAPTSRFLNETVVALLLGS